MLAIPAVLASVVAILGIRAAQKNSDWWGSIHHPSLTPSLPVMGASWAVAHLLFGLGVGISMQETAGALVPVLAAIAVLAGWLWVMTLFGRQSVRNGFFMISVAWGPAALTAMAAAVLSPLAGGLTAVLGILLTVAAVWSFIVWQINEPTRYR